MSAGSTTRGEQFTLVVFTCAAVAAFGSAFNQPAAWVFWLPAIVSPFAQVRRLPRVVVKWGRFAAWPALAGALTTGLVLMAYPPLFSERTTQALIMISGYGLGLCATLFLLGTALWNPAETVIPAATGLTVVACFNPMAVITPLLVTPAAAAFVYLLLLNRRRWRRMLSVRLAVTAVASGAIAFVSYTQLPRLQQQVEVVTMRWLSGETSAANPFGIQSQLGDLERLQLSRRVVLRVWTPHAQKLRARVFARFDGRTWHASLTSGMTLQRIPEDSHPAGLDNIPGSTFLFPIGKEGIPAGANPTRIVQSVASPGVLASPGNKVLVRVPVPSLRADEFDNLIPALTSQVPIYGALSLPDAAEVGTGIDGPKEDFLEVPVDLDPRWGALAAQLAAPTPSRDQQVARTINYVKHAATYSLEVGRFRSPQPVTEFFFETKRGYCQYFATAGALLLRLEGIPARYVTGYNVQEYNEPGGYYVVRDADAHAWVEVRVPGKGWMEADPTPEAEFAARRAANSPGRLAEYGEWLSGVTVETWALLSQSDWRGATAILWQAIKMAFRAGVLVIAFVLMLGAGLAWARTRRHRLKRELLHPPPAAVTELDLQLNSVCESLDRSWEKAGISRSPSQGLLEHVQAIRPEKVPAPFLDLSRRLVLRYYRLRFGDPQPAASDLGELQQLSAQLAEGAERMTNREA